MSCIIILLFKTSNLKAFHLFSFSIRNQILAGSYRYLLKLLSWRMIAARVLFVTHSSSLVIPSGRAPRQRCRGSMFLFTKGMAHNLEFTEKYVLYLQNKKLRAMNLSSTHSFSFYKIYFTFFF